jgi:phosphatidate phosphatase APP1
MGSSFAMSTYEHELNQLATSAEVMYPLLPFSSVMVVPFWGYGTPQQLFVRGRVTRTSTVRPAERDDSRWQNIRNTYRRFRVSGVAGAEVQVRLGHLTHVMQSDQDGFFQAVLTPNLPDISSQLPPQYNWREARFSLVQPAMETGTPFGSVQANATERRQVIGQMMIPPASAEFGIISDLDDTVLSTHVHSKVKMVWNAFTKNAYTRTPVAGISGFYQALQNGRIGTQNPIFFVSSSPVQLHSFLQEFLRVHNIPQGPLFLRHVYWENRRLVKTPREIHKKTHIQALLDLYKKLPFVLVGDSGEVDVDIYLDIAETNPGRIKAIYIRDLSESDEDMSHLETLRQRAKLAGVELCLARDNLSAALHASQIGLIQPRFLPMILQQVSG